MTEYDDSEYVPRTRRHQPRKLTWWERATAPESGRVWIAAIGVVVVAAVLLGGLELAVTSGRVHPGVTVGGVRVGGLTQAEAQGRLSAELPQRAAASPVVVVWNDRTWTVSSRDLGVDYNYPALAASAMEVGRSGGFFAQVGARVSAWIRPVSMSASATADPEKLAAFMDEVDKPILVKPKSASVSANGTTFVLIPSSKGRALDRTRFTPDLLGAFTSTSRRVSAPVSAVEPAVDDAAAQAALNTAKAFVASPARVVFGAKTMTFAPDTIAKWVAFRTADASAAAEATQPLSAYISSAELSGSVLPHIGIVGTPPRDARFKTRNGVVTIIPSKDGRGPDVAALAADLTAALANASGPRTATLRINVQHPSITTEVARNMGVNERISTFTTSYDPGNAPRVNNIHILGNALDGKLVPPGGVFSFNGYVGERTAAKGYEEANAIVQGKLVPQLGGGICQVGTTMFNAVFFSGLPILERHNHSFYISHYPKGRDATVSWGGPDLKWKNETKNWVLISVSYSDSSITISLYGTDPGYDVSYVTSPFSNIRPYPTQTVKDPTLALGAKYVTDKGENGMTCTVTRTVRKGGEVVRTDTFVSDYSPKIEVVKVGTIPIPSKTTTATVPPKH